MKKRKCIKKWFAKTKIILVAASGILVFLVSTVIPLFRRDMLPSFNPAALVDISVRLFSDEPTTVYQNIKDGIVYCKDQVFLSLRVSNKSEYPLTIEDVILSFSRREYGSFDKNSWQQNPVYTGGADAYYSAFGIYIQKSYPQGRRFVFRSAKIIDVDQSSYRQVVYKIPPFETDYIPVVIRYMPFVSDDSVEQRLEGLVLEFVSKCILRGKQFLVTSASPVQVLFISEQISREIDETFENEHILDAEALYSPTQEYWREYEQKK